jgi:putative ABC transport system ATP-binding protein
MEAPAALVASGYRMSVRDVSRTYEGKGDATTIHALRGVNLDLEAGSATALTGPSGSGKSTLLHLLGGMDSPDQGSIMADDLTITTLSRGGLVDYRRTVGFVFQHFALLPALTARDNVMVPVLPYSTEFNKTGRADELLALVGLEGRENALPSQLSGGQQQRVAIARGLVNNPRLLLADEPTGNLDTTTGEQILDLLLGLRDQRGVTVALATHDPGIAKRCDDVVAIRDGIVAD